MPPPPFVEPPETRESRAREDRCFVSTGCRRQNELGAPRVGHQGNRVLFLEFLGQQAERFAQQRQLFRRHHRAGDVDEKDQIDGGPAGSGNLSRLQANAHQPVLGLPERLRNLRMDRDRIAPGRRRVIVLEVVEHLLDADGIDRRPLVRVQEPPQIRVGSGVDVG